MVTYTADLLADCVILMILDGEPGLLVDYVILMILDGELYAWTSGRLCDFYDFRW